MKIEATKGSRLYCLALLLHFIIVATLFKSTHYWGPNLSDSRPIWFWTYLILNLSDSEPIWFWTYLIPNLSDSEGSETIWYRTHLITNLMPVWGWPLLCFLLTSILRWLPTPPRALCCDKTDQLKFLPLSQLRMTANCSQHALCWVLSRVIKKFSIISLVSDKFGIW